MQTDLISRSAAMNTLSDVFGIPLDYDGECNEMCDEAFAAIEALPSVDAVPVVRCRACALHGHCAVEDMLTLSGFTDGYCRAGKRVSNVVSGARMDGKKSEEATNGHQTN